MINDVVNALLVRVQAMGLTLDGKPVDVVAAKQPRQQQGESTNTQVTVHPAQRPHAVRQLDTESDLHTYRVVVTAWTPGNADNSVNAPGYSAIDDTVTHTLNASPAELAGLDGLYDVHAETGQYVDRGAFVKGWDVQQVLVEVQIVRAR